MNFFVVFVTDGQTDRQKAKPKSLLCMSTGGLKNMIIIMVYHMTIPPIPPSAWRIFPECCPPSVSAKRSPSTRQLPVECPHLADTRLALAGHSTGNQQALGRHSADTLGGQHSIDTRRELRHAQQRSNHTDGKKLTYRIKMCTAVMT